MDQQLDGHPATDQVWRGLANQPPGTNNLNRVPRTTHPAKMFTNIVSARELSDLKALGMCATQQQRIPTLEILTAQEERPSI